jgi:hypothetical protein
MTLTRTDNNAERGPLGSDAARNAQPLACDSERLSDGAGHDHRRRDHTSRDKEKARPKLHLRPGSSRDAERHPPMPLWHVGLSVVNRDDRSSHDPRT